MICTEREYVTTDANGKEWYRCVIVAPEDPEILNIEGADVEGVPNSAGIAAGSCIITPTSNFIAIADGTFALKSASGGGDADVIAITSASIENISDTPDIEMPRRFSDAEGSSIAVGFSTFGSIATGIYDITVVPGSNAYLYDPAQDGWADKGEPVTASYEYEGGSFEYEGIAVTTDPNNEAEAYTVYIYVDMIM